MNTITIDTEYSNLNVEKGELLQLGAVVEMNGEKHYFNEYARAENRSTWSVHAEKIHQISFVRSQEHQPLKELAKKFKEFLDQFDTVLTAIGWNCYGDKKYLDKLIRVHLLKANIYYKIRPNWIDVFKMVKDRKEQIRLPDYKLPTVAKYFKLEFKAHDASEDARVTKDIYDLITGINKDNADFVQVAITKRMSEIDLKHKYMDQKYVSVNNGEIYITKEATQDKVAMRVIFSELWSIFGEK